MRIFDALRGHFALMTGRQLCDLGMGDSFIVERVVNPSEPVEDQLEDWLIVLRPRGGGDRSAILLTDVLRVYTQLVCSRCGDWYTPEDIQAVIESSGANPEHCAHIMALLATFDDIESQSGGESAIRYVPHWELYGGPVDDVAPY